MVCNKDGIEDNEHKTLQKENKRSRGVALLCCKKPYWQHFIAKKKRNQGSSFALKKKELDSFLLKKGNLVLFFCKTKKKNCKKNKK
jgi:hypothetical protein